MVKAATGNTTPPKITEITTKIIGLLNPLSSEDRHRVMKASFTLLGEKALDAGASSEGGDPTLGQDGGKGGSSGQSGKPRVATWMRSFKLRTDELEHVFDTTTNPVEVIGTNVPGKSKKYQTINAYVLEGIRSLLATGEPSFDDKSARKLCGDLGCFNLANHIVYMKGKGNLMSGSKAQGWKLSAPGLAKGAQLIHEMAKGL
jgi:hypothetical protein